MLEQQLFLVGHVHQTAPTTLAKMWAGGGNTLWRSFQQFHHVAIGNALFCIVDAHNGLFAHHQKWHKHRCVVYHANRFAVGIALRCENYFVVLF